MYNYYILSGSSTPTACPIGEYANVTGESSCDLCPAGWMCYAKSEPQICPQGMWHYTSLSTGSLVCRCAMSHLPSQTTSISSSENRSKFSKFILRRIIINIVNEDTRRRNLTLVLEERKVKNLIMGCPFVKHLLLAYQVMVILAWATQRHWVWTKTIHSDCNFLLGYVWSLCLTSVPIKVGKF